jgi:hypothetical protein
MKLAQKARYSSKHWQNAADINKYFNVAEMNADCIATYNSNPPKLLLALFMSYLC